MLTIDDWRLVMDSSLTEQRYDPQLPMHSSSEQVAHYASLYRSHSTIRACTGRARLVSALDDINLLYSLDDRDLPSVIKALSSISTRRGGWDTSSLVCLNYHGHTTTLLRTAWPVLSPADHRFLRSGDHTGRRLLASLDHNCVS